jgi:hypothetical protein
MTAKLIILSSNNFALLNTNPGNSYQKIIRKIVILSKSLIQHENKWKYISLNPTSPTKNGLLDP